MIESMVPGTALPPAPPAPAPAHGRLNMTYLVIVGVAMGIVSLFTLLAWIPAILTGMVIGRADVERSQGIKASGATSALRVLAVTGGVLAMLFFGAFIGGLISFLVAAGASFTERLVAGTSPIDQTIGRILVVTIAVVIWFVAINVLRFNFNLTFG